jgi:hypothetical protein
MALMATAVAPTYTATRKWRRWAGTLGDLDRVLKEAVDGLRQWLEAEPRCFVSVGLPALTMDFYTIEDLQTVSNDVRKVKTIHVWLNAGGRGPSVSITIDEDSPAVSLEVKGDDRVRVEGLRTRLGDLLNNGRRRPRWLLQRELLMVSGTLVVPILWTALLIGIQNLASFLRWPLPVQGNNLRVEPLLGSGVVAVALFVGLCWLFPDLELLLPGERTRYQRLRGAVYGVLLGVVSIIVAAPLVNLLFGRNP